MSYEQLPYKILALGPFAPVPEEKFKPDFLEVDLYSIEEAIEKLSPVLYIPLPLDICPDGAVTLKFKGIKDFKPKSIIKNNSYLASLSNKKKAASSSFKKSDPTPSSKEEKSSIDDILSMVATSDSSDDTPTGSSSGLSSKNDQADSEASSIIREIFSNREFQKTESAWRGLQNLVKKADIKGFEKIRVSISSVSHNSLETVLDEIASLPYDEIPNLVLIDLGFDNTMPSIELLEKVIKFTDIMLLPACVWIKPEFFRIENFNQIHKIPYIKNHLDDVSYAKFKKVKILPGAAWLIATCNYFAVRPAHDFEEQPLFVSPVWGIGTLFTMSVNNSGWPTGFTRYNTNRIEDLAMVDCDGKNTASTQALFSEDRIMQLVEAGITPVVGMKNKDVVFIPKESSLAGDSIKFQLFINRVIEMLIHLKEDGISDNYVEEGISSAVKDIFIQTGHHSPDDVLVINDNNALDGQKVFHISFTPPESVIAGLGKIEFSFAW
ncbi:type VI secretion system contractile sheath large subunit [Desulfobacula sp.]|uniref:type VI secretion system contractile sheath domain-containing protein n=1 Tax=Desulfobacula sp. TaxID=2593537 RepID=UPI0026393AD7|nr:type VI secretion system contractile sheath large subunit [Desulfobacula sp.]